MNKKDLHIVEPCSAEWESMHGDHQTRFCDHCTKNVHNISMMKAEDADVFLEAELPQGICVQYACNTDGDIMFADTPDPQWRTFAQDQGARLLIAAAAMAVPMLMAGCDDPQSPIEPVATSPIEIKEGQPIKLNVKPGASRTPPKVVPTKHIEMLKGDIAEHRIKPKIEVTMGEPPVQAHEDKDTPACDGEKTENALTKSPSALPKKLEKVEKQHPKVLRGKVKSTHHKPYLKKMGKVAIDIDDVDEDKKEQVKRLD